MYSAGRTKIQNGMGAVDSVVWISCIKVKGSERSCGCTVLGRLGPPSFGMGRWRGERGGGLSSIALLSLGRSSLPISLGRSPVVARSIAPHFLHTFFQKSVKHAPNQTIFDFPPPTMISCCTLRCLMTRKLSPAPTPPRNGSSKLIARYHR